jgi:hypothetical protein
MRRPLVRELATLCLAGACATAPAPKVLPMAASEFPTLKLLATGSEPRRVLREGPVAELRPEACVLTERHEGGNQPRTAPVQYALEATPQEGGIGEVRYWDVRVTSAQALETLEVDPTIAAALRQALARNVGATVRFASGPRGALSPDDVGGSDPVYIATVKRWLRHTLPLLVAPPLPEEAVGAGARWEAANERDDASFRAIYRLARLDADRLTLDFSVEIKALSASAGVQAGDIVWSGAGQLEVDLRRLWPTSASLRLASPQSPHALAVDQGATVETRVLDLRARTP